MVEIAQAHTGLTWVGRGIHANQKTDHSKEQTTTLVGWQKATTSDLKGIIIKHWANEVCFQKQLHNDYITDYSQLLTTFS